MFSPTLLERLSSRHHVSQRDIVLLFVKLLVPYLPPGEPHASGVGLSAGWIPLAGIHPVIRRWLLDEHSLWAAAVCSVPSTTAISMFLDRSGDCPISIDLTLLYRHSSHRDFPLLMALLMNRDTFAPPPVIRAIEFLPMHVDNLSYHAGIRHYLEAWPVTFSGVTFAHLARLTLHVLSSFPAFSAPSLEELVLLGVRTSETMSVVTSWKFSPKISLSNFRSLLEGVQRLVSVEIRNLDLDANSTRCNPLQLHDSLQTRILSMRSASAVTAFLACLRSARDTETVIVTRIPYGDLLPDWTWGSAGLNPARSLALVAESCNNFIWLTFLSIDDAASATRPVYCDADDPYSISEARPNRPNLFVRNGRISRLYIPDKLDAYRNALCDDILSRSSFIRALYVSELAVKVDGVDVWLRKAHNFVPYIMRSLDDITSRVIEDERMAHLPLYASSTCSNVHFYCRDDWYGLSHLSYFTQAILDPRCTYVKHVWLHGALRTVDLDLFAKFATACAVRFVVLHDKRKDVGPSLPVVGRAAELRTARAIEHYHMMKVVSLELERDMDGQH
ncbi:unnamed protein product [Peniophora sp. CBMAI 1063]|nr:unnamed protein product [Peniophora sp. CBMAI 1063]